VASRGAAAEAPRRDEVEKAFRRLRSADQVAEELGQPVGKVRGLLSELGLLHLTVERGGHRSDAPWPAERVLEALRLAAEALGGETLTAGRYQAWRATSPGVELPTVRTVTLRFGSWRTAVEAAGLASGRRGRTVDSFAREAPELEQAVREYAWGRWDAGERATIAGYASWARECGAPSRSTVQARYGSWTEAMTAAAELGRP
jgi:hypothetical protein